MNPNATKSKHHGDSPWALVPVKPLARAKQRLGPCLGEHRRGLARAMFLDVAQCLVDSKAFAGVAVVTADTLIGELSARLGIRVIDELSSGMNQAIAQGVQAIRDAGGHGVAIIPADVPLITPGETRRVLSGFRAARGDRKPAVGIVPARDLGGTNLLIIEGDVEFPFAYGPGSFHRHEQAAREIGLPCFRLDSAAFALDIDEECDLEALLAVCKAERACRRTATCRFLQAAGYALTEPGPRRAINQ